MAALRRQCATYKRRVATLQDQLKRSFTLIAISSLDIRSNLGVEMDTEKHHDDELYQKHRDILEKWKSTSNALDAINRPDDDDEKEPVMFRKVTGDEQSLLMQQEERLSRIHGDEYLGELESHQKLLLVE